MTTRTRVSRARMRYKIHDWKYVTIKGDNYFELGRSHGRQLSKELSEVFRRLKFYIPEYLKHSYNDCLNYTRKMIKPVVLEKYPNIYEEIRGISQGAQERGVNISVDEILLWNSSETLYSFFFQKKSNGHNHRHRLHHRQGERCSAFIASGNHTKNGGIIMAHNSHCDFITGQIFNIYMRVYPPDGINFTMQTAPGLVFSMADWFTTSAGIVGCETTLENIITPIKTGAAPIFCRARQAMQYSNSIDDFAKYLWNDNAGDYSCGWLVGDTKTGEIARIEIGVSEYAVDRKFDGYYIGCNIAFEKNVVEKDTAAAAAPTTPKDFRISTTNRCARLEYLMEQSAKKLDAKMAREILADHYDTEKEKYEPNSHSICKHVENDDGIGHPDVNQPYYPRGVYDGKVLETRGRDRGSGTRVWLRWGSACGRKFSVKKHIKKHPQYKKYGNYMDNFSATPWKRAAAV